MSDGEIICSPGQIMINNGVVQNDNQGRFIVPASLFNILPRTNGEKPCHPSFILIFLTNDFYSDISNDYIDLNQNNYIGFLSGSGYPYFSALKPPILA